MKNFEGPGRNRSFPNGGQILAFSWINLRVSKYVRNMAETFFIKIEFLDDKCYPQAITCDVHIFEYFFLSTSREIA
jgi:hypothetical protein